MFISFVVSEDPVKRTITFDKQHFRTNVPKHMIGPTLLNMGSLVCAQQGASADIILQITNDYAQKHASDFEHLRKK